MRLAAVALMLAGAASGCHDELDPRYAETGARIPVPAVPGEIPTPASSPPPPFGDGRDGDLSITTTVVQDLCVPLTDVNGARVSVGTLPEDLAEGDVVLLHQAQDGDAPSDTTPTAAVPGLAGHAQVARVVALAGLEVSLDALAEVVSGETSQQAQLCRLPQYETVTVANGGRLLARAWDGSSGGVVGFFALVLEMQPNGHIDATGAGFRGGVATANGLMTSTQLDTTATAGGGKGEGPVRRSLGLYGRGAIASAAGGGNARRAGGGGGGNGGAGGAGGRGPDNGTQGAGGAALVQPSGARRLLFGGGGGAGQQATLDAGAGGSGGGVIFVRAQVVAGSGNLLADGLPGGNSFDDAAGGGGAGGSILLEVESDGYSGAAQARGGAGGEADGNSGAGGGGGGGWIDAPAASGASAGGGPGGLTGTAAGSGAAGGDGVVAP